MEFHIDDFGPAYIDKAKIQNMQPGTD